MASDRGRWTLEELIDFEHGIDSGASTPPDVRDAVLAASRGLEGAAARRMGFRTWLGGMPSAHAGRRFRTSLSLAGSGLAALAWCAGVSAVFGTVNRQVHGMHVVGFLAALIGGQWLLLSAAGLAWSLRGRGASGFSAVQGWIATAVRKLAGERDQPWWERVMNDGGPARAALLWRITRVAQSAGIAFNLGILCGLCALFLTKDLRFFWESSTETAMADTLLSLTRWLSIPWSAWWPAAVPDATAIAGARWHPGGPLPAPDPVWWRFALMATVIWGLLPRLILWWLAWSASRRALGSLDFQSRCHRAMWRSFSGPDRMETDEKPLDGVLVLDVGGSGIHPDALRGFLLRRLRVNPTSWLPVAVLDTGAEPEVSLALAMAPAGVVLLAEGWALSPARMLALHARIRRQAGDHTPIKFLIANAVDAHSPAPPTREERHEWERWTDSLKDPMAEVFFFQDDPAGG